MTPTCQTRLVLSGYVLQELVACLLKVLDSFLEVFQGLMRRTSPEVCLGIASIQLCCSLGILQSCLGISQLQVCSCPTRAQQYEKMRHACVQSQVHHQSPDLLQLPVLTDLHQLFQSGMCSWLCTWHDCCKCWKAGATGWGSVSMQAQHPHCCLNIPGCILWLQPWVLVSHHGTPRLP